MVSLEKCYEILNQNTQNYTMEEVKEIRKTLYQMAEIIYESKLMNDEKPQRENSSSIQKS
jgi:hypothetical protein